MGDFNGNSNNNIDITKYFEENDSLSKMRTDSNGNLYIRSDKSKLLIISKDGKMITLPKSNDLILDIAADTGNTIYALTISPVGFYICSIDSNGQVNKISQMNIMISKLADGNEKYTLFFIDKMSLYGMNMDDNTATRILNWTDINMGAKYFDAFYAVNESAYLCYDLTTLYSITPAEKDNKKTLTLASYKPNINLIRYVSDYNIQNEGYRIEIIDYSQYNVSLTGEEGLDKLNTEIITGNVPDIFDFSNYYLPADLYIKKGLVEDLYPYLDNDPALSRDDLFTSVLSAYEQNGSLYQAPSSFTVIAYIGLKDIVGDSPQWTMDDMLSLIKNAPAGTESVLGYNREMMLKTLGRYALDKYINWDTGECMFESKEFIKLLNYVETLPENPPSNSGALNKFLNGEALISREGFNDVFKLTALRAVFGDNYVIKDFPADNGSGSYITIGNPILGISSTCSDKNAAWSFVRGMFTEDFEDNMLTKAFPLNKMSFNKLVQIRFKSFEEDPDHKESVLVCDQSIVIDMPNEDDINELLELIDSCDTVLSNNDMITSIVWEEAQAFFAGDRSAEAAAEIIQRRISTYVNEQR